MKYVPVRRRNSEDDVFSLQRGVNRLFDNLFDESDLVPFDPFGRVATTVFSPQVKVSETDKEITVSAELPRMSEKDISVEVGDDALMIRGEKKEAHEEKG